MIGSAHHLLQENFDSIGLLKCKKEYIWSA